MIIAGFLKLFWREFLISILVLLLIGAVNTVHNRDRSISLLQNTRDSAYSVAHYYKNREGELIGQIKTHEVTIGELKEFKNDIGIEVDELKRQIGSLSRLVGRWQGRAQFIDWDTITVPVYDTIINQATLGKFEWNNNYLELRGLIGNKQVSLAYTYDLEFDFDLTSYWKGKNLFKKGTLVTDIKFSDQNMKVSEFKGIVIKQPPKKWYETRAFAFGTGFVLASYLWLK